jgi:type II secretory pathway component GspD/PulD (secretin)
MVCDPVCLTTLMEAAAMSMKTRCSLMVSAVAVLAFTAPAEPQAGKTDDAKTKRLAYVVQHGSAKNFAALLVKHFKSAVDVEASDAPGNVLLINAEPAVVDELLATLAKLDRKPQMVAVDMYVLQIQPRKAADGKAEPGYKAIDEKELSGAADKVTANLQALQKKGAVSGFKRFQVTAIENQQTKILNGESLAYITGSMNKGGIGRYMVVYKSIGTSATLTPRVAGDKTVTLELNLDDSWAYQPEEGPPVATDDAGLAIRATDFVVSKLDTSVSVPAGQAVFVSGVEAKSKSGKARTLLVVTARVIP